VRHNSLYVCSPIPAKATDVSQQCHRVLHHESQAERVAFYHAALGSPAIPTFINCIRRGYITLPGLTAAMIQRNLPNPIAMSRGHLDALRKNLRSTKAPAILDTELEPEPEYIPTPESLMDTCPHGIICQIHCKAKLYADATGRLPTPTRSGIQYLMVFFCEASNYIHIEGMPDRTSSSHLDAIKRAIQFFRQRKISVTIFF
jgi:hypothetical protein